MQDGALRLAGGTQNSSGVVEVYVDGLWISVCERYWDNVAAQVACRQLGYGGGFAIAGKTLSHIMLHYKIHSCLQMKLNTIHYKLYKTC